KSLNRLKSEAPASNPAEASRPLQADLTRRRRLTGIFALLLATIIWLSSVHFLFVDGRRSSHPVSTRARALANRHLALWTDPALKEHELSRMRRSNPEWDFMGRSFLVWSLAEMGVREPDQKQRYLPVMDLIIEDTVRLEREGGIYTFLMSYAKDRPFVKQPARSLFVDSEIALMMGLRRMLAEKQEYREPLHER